MGDGADRERPQHGFAEGPARRGAGPWVDREDPGGQGDDAGEHDDRRDDELFRELYPGLRRFAAVTASCDLDPDDLLQEAVARVLRTGSLHRLDHPGAYLRRTIVNLASNHNRSRARERRARERLGVVREGADGVYPSDLADLDHLAPADRAAVYLADVERLPFVEVASALGVNGAAARARVSRARRRLREALDETTAPSEPVTRGRGPTRPGASDTEGGRA